jgi:hypothetical protein
VRPVGTGRPRAPAPWRIGCDSGNVSSHLAPVDSTGVSEMQQPAGEPIAPAQPSFRGWMGSMWLYTLLRFGMFFALWGIAYLIGFHGFLGPLIALVVSVPLSLFLLAKPRERFTQQLELRMQARQVDRQRFDAELDPDADRRD